MAWQDAVQDAPGGCRILVTVVAAVAARLSHHARSAAGVRDRRKAAPVAGARADGGRPAEVLEAA